MLIKMRLVLAVFAVATFSGCATTYIKADATTNPPPSQPFSAFSKFAVSPITMGAPYKGQEANEKALKKIQQNFDLRVNPKIETWAANAGASGRTLRIEPYIQDIKFINATARVWGGAFSGSSAVVLRMKLIDASSGAEIAHPQFFQRAAAMGGAWTLGATDNNMLVRIAELASNYLETNYKAAVGGPTGAPETTK
jgi:hypothetical protein